jgi:hypothetical protein
MTRDSRRAVRRPRGEGDGVAGGAVASDLRGVPVAFGDPEAGARSFADLPTDPGDETAGGSLRGVQPQFDAHGLVPEHRGHDRADEGSHRAADRSGFGVRRDDLHRCDCPGQNARQARGPLRAIEVLAGQQRGGEQGELGCGKHRGAFDGAAHVEVVGGEPPAGVRAVGGAADRSQGRDPHGRRARPALNSTAAGALPEQQPGQQGDSAEQGGSEGEEYDGGGGERR